MSLPFICHVICDNDFSSELFNAFHRAQRHTHRKEEREREGKCEGNPHSNIALIWGFRRPFSAIVIRVFFISASALRHFRSFFTYFTVRHLNMCVCESVRNENSVCAFALLCFLSFLFISFLCNSFFMSSPFALSLGFALKLFVILLEITFLFSILCYVALSLSLPLPLHSLCLCFSRYIVNIFEQWAPDVVVAQSARRLCQVPGAWCLLAVEGAGGARCGINLKRSATQPAAKLANTQERCLLVFGFARCRQHQQQQQEYKLQGVINHSVAKWKYRKYLPLTNSPAKISLHLAELPLSPCPVHALLFRLLIYGQSHRIHLAELPFFLRFSVCIFGILWFGLVRFGLVWLRLKPKVLPFILLPPWRVLPLLLPLPLPMSLPLRLQLLDLSRWTARHGEGSTRNE